MKRFVVLIVTFATSLALFGASPASAHSSEESYLFLDVASSDLGGTVQIPYDDLTEVLGIDFGDSTESKTEAAIANLDTIHAYATEHLTIGVDGQTWPVTFDGFDLLENLLEWGDATHLVLPFTVDLGGADVPQVLDVQFDVIIHAIDGRANLAIVYNDWQRGVFEQETNTLQRFTEAGAVEPLDLGETSQWSNFTESISLGVDHIKTGPDHVFFVLVLLLPSVLVLSSGRWDPAPTFGSTFWRILKIVSMFTVAHSVTFTLAGLGILPLPSSKLVESLIAFSIAVAALYNLRPKIGDREWMIAFGFGLFHGMGFASLVDDLEVDRTTELVSLLGRNVGIEIGQLFVVLITFPAVFLLRRTVYYRPFFVAGSVTLAIVSLFWMVERIFEVETGMSDLVDKVMRFPRILVPLAIFTVVCAGLRWKAEQDGTLLDVAEADSADDAELVGA